MSGLFIELYLDEDVSVLVRDLLLSRGFLALTAREAGQLGKSDEEQLSFAEDNQKVFLTHNRLDFERLAREYFLAGKQHDGIIIAVRRPPQELVQRLLSVLNQVTAGEMKNQIRYI